MLLQNKLLRIAVVKVDMKHSHSHSENDLG